MEIYKNKKSGKDINVGSLKNGGGRGLGRQVIWWSHCCCIPDSILTWHSSKHLSIKNYTIYYSWNIQWTCTCSLFKLTCYYNSLKKLSSVLIICTLGWFFSLEYSSSTEEEDVYNTSPKMSTYLVAFVVSQFQSRAGTFTKGKVHVKWFMHVKKLKIANLS